jgi:hypothetical protein
LHDAKQRRRDRHDEEEMENAAHRVRGGHADQPQDKKHDDDGTQHDILLLSIVAIIESAAPIDCPLLNISSSALRDTL